MAAAAAEVLEAAMDELGLLVEEALLEELCEEKVRSRRDVQ